MKGKSYTAEQLAEMKQASDKSRTERFGAPAEPPTGESSVAEPANNARPLTGPELMAAALARTEAMRKLAAEQRAQAAEKQEAEQQHALARVEEAEDGTALVAVPQPEQKTATTLSTVRGTRDDARTEAVLSAWEEGVHADAARNGGVVPPKSSGRSMYPSVRLNGEPRAVPPPADTESELNGLISECRFLLHEIAFHSAHLTYDADDRIRFLSAAESLARTAATVGDTVSRLRNHGAEPVSVHEHHQRVTVEHVVRNTRGEGGRGKSGRSSGQ